MRTQFFAFLLDQFFAGFPFSAAPVRGPRQLVAQHIQLNFQTEQCLEDPVVQIARNAAAFGFHGPRRQVAQKKYILQRRAQRAGRFAPASGGRPC